MTRQDGYAGLALLGMTILVFARYLFAWPTPLILSNSELGTDLPREILPLAHFITDSLEQTGTLPLWRPYLLSGAPLIGHPVAPVLYPPHWLVLLVPLALALNISAVVHLWWAGVGTYLVLRLESKIHRESALIGALIFGLAPKWMAHLSGGHWPMIAAIAWWPWAWLALQRYWSTRRTRWLVLLGIALAAQAVNHGHVLALCGISLGVGTAGHLLRGRRDALRPAFTSGIAALGLMGGLAAGQLWPLLELLPFTNRTTMTQTDAAIGSLPPELLVGILFPTALKFPEWYLFPGVLALLLMLIGWKRISRWWLAAALAGLMLSLGVHTPIHAILYDWVPGFSLFRVPTRWWILTLFSIAMLAGQSAEHWLTTNIPRPRLIRPLIGLGAIYLSAAGLSLALPGQLPFSVVPHALALMVGGALLFRTPSRAVVAALVVVLVADLGIAGNRLARPGFESDLAPADQAAIDYILQNGSDSTRTLALYDALLASHVVTAGLRTADGYDPMQLSTYAGLVRQAIGCDYDSYTVTVPPTQASTEARDACPDFRPRPELLALLNVQFVLLEDNPGTALPTAVVGERQIADIGPGYGRAFGVAQAITAPPDACLEQLARIDPAQTAVVERDLSFPPGGMPPEVLKQAFVPNGERFTVVARDAGLLVRSESWAPGWRVTIDDAPADVMRADCALQGVWLEPGQHEVHFEYRPQGYRIGRWISLGTAGLVLVWIGWRIALALRRRTLTGSSPDTQSTSERKPLASN